MTGYQAEAIRRELAPTLTVHNPKFMSGMHSSIRKGLQALENFDAVMICLADQPAISLDVLRALEAQFQPGKIVFPTFQNERGHPVLISKNYVPEILAHEDGDYGCSYLFKRYPANVVTVPTDHASILQDIDTPADYQKFAELA